MVTAARKAAAQASVSECDGGSPGDLALTGSLLSLLTTDYFAQCNADEQTLAELTGGVPFYNVVSSGVATATAPYSSTAASENADLPFPYMPAAVSIDAANNNYLAFSNNGTETALRAVVRAADLSDPGGRGAL